MTRPAAMTPAHTHDVWVSGCFRAANQATRWSTYRLFALMY